MKHTDEEISSALRGETTLKAPKQRKQKFKLATTRKQAKRRTDSGVLWGGGFYMPEFDPPRRSARKVLKGGLQRAYDDLLEGKRIPARAFRNLRRCGVVSGTQAKAVV